MAAVLHGGGSGCQKCEALYNAAVTDQLEADAAAATAKWEAKIALADWGAVAQAQKALADAESFETSTRLAVAILEAEVAAFRPEEPPPSLEQQLDNAIELHTEAYLREQGAQKALDQAQAKWNVDLAAAQALAALASQLRASAASEMNLYAQCVSG